MTRFELAIIALKRIAYGIPGADEDIWDKATIAEVALAEIAQDKEDREGNENV